MGTSSDPWTSPSDCAAGRQLLQLSLPVLNALGDGDLALARTIDSHDYTPYLVSDECRSVWKRRADQIRADPQDSIWITRLAITTQGVVVGRAGFHGQPDERGMVEIGYSIDPLHRRQGHARAAVRILLDTAANDPRIQRVRASISPDNVPSMNLVKSFGFQQVGEQWDEEDGLELVFELPVN
ncbi:GCN5-related n-acetyltransferase (GNAT) domain protein [Fusarium beomiforme]|uniref:GCN5-related n-acetyltransferase (GNAT) domain protein n=1 Tax=Fusarium beomiforme TaxID=44412 RepID=A0A9P5APC4_9HYPO|nr:GCN5-related n-acetyltransferase (GNAT) domain protein [Fusarium beomiforme]